MTNYEKLVEQLDNDPLGLLSQINDAPNVHGCVLGILLGTGDGGIKERCKEYGDDFCELCLCDWLYEENEDE